MIERCLEIGMQASIGGNLPWPHFVVVTDETKRAGLAALYHRVFFEEYLPTISAERRLRTVETSPPGPTSPSICVRYPSTSSPAWRGRVDGKPPFVAASRYGGILPAVWSFMLARRARGVGAAWTTPHLRYGQETVRLLAIPPGLTQAALLPVAHYLGADFKPASRVPARERTYRNHWGTTRSVGG